MVAMSRPPALPTPPSTAPLAPGTTVEVDAEARWLDATHLAGGTPFRIMGFSGSGAALVRTWQHPTPIGTTLSHGVLARRLVDAGLAHPTFASSLESRSVTVVIPVRDRAADLDVLLDSLRGLDVLVVDDGSDDAAAIAAVVATHAARLHRRSAAGGPSAARNAGLAMVTTEFACLIDSDCRPPAGFLSALLPALADPQVALVAPRITGGPADGIVGRFEQACSPLDVGRRAALVRPGGTTTFVPSACMVLRTSLGADLFDEALTGGEDVDLVWRLAEAGWSVRFDPSVVVHHPARATMTEWWSQRAFYGATATDLAQRHGDAVAPIGGSAVTVGAWTATALGWPMLGAAMLGAGSTMLARRLEGVVAQPRSAAVRLLLRSSLASGPVLARQAVRSYAPLLVLAGLASRRVRWAAVAAGLLGALNRWWSADTDLDPIRFTALSLADDAAYGVGLWGGVLRSRRAGALRPRLLLMRRSDGEGAPGTSTS